jgi:hypothetical protein
MLPPGIELPEGVSMGTGAMGPPHKKMESPPEIGESMVADMEQINYKRLRQCQNVPSDARPAAFALQPCSPARAATTLRAAPSATTTNSYSVSLSWSMGRCERAQAGRLGTWKSSTLFLGRNGTVGARSTLHHDQHDSLLLQVAGRKRFVIYPPYAAAASTHTTESV